MKTFLFVTLFFAGAIAVAKGGGNKPMTPARFMGEAVEHSLALAANSGFAEVTQVGAQANADKTVIAVDLYAADGAEKSYNCNLIDEVSGGGTVIKKDVVCIAQ